MLVVESNICTALYPRDVIGSKVLDREAFNEYLYGAILTHDPATDRIPGQHYLVLPAAAYHTVSCGVGLKTAEPADYAPRLFRGHVGLYLKRRLAAEVEHLAAVVYTREAYLNDPDVVNDEAEKMFIERYPLATHVLVAVLASAGGRSPLPMGTLVRNLAGANHEALAWTADEIRAKARESLEFWEKWSIVAD
jgi:hypothetical protein